MDASPLMQDMDALLINPTVKSTNMSGDLIPIFMSDEVFTIKAGKKAVEPIGTIRSYADDSIFGRGYASDEEAASPTEDNDSSFHSTSDTESTPSIKTSPSLEDLSDDVKVIQLCTKAHAVQYVSAGKAKIVSVVKPVEVVSPGGSVRTASKVVLRKVPQPIPRAPSSTQSSSPRSSSERSPEWPLAGSFAGLPKGQRAIRRKPNLAPLQTLPSATSTRSIRKQTPLANQRADFSRHSSFSSTWPLGSPVSPPRQQPAKVSPSFSLRSFGRPRQSTSSSNESSDGSGSRAELRSVTTPPGSARTSNTTPKPLPKMVPRGASERAPPIVLPPCPDDFRDDWSVGYPSQWPLRDDSILTSAASDTPRALKQRWRKSGSAAFVTTLS